MFFLSTIFGTLAGALFKNIIYILIIAIIFCIFLYKFYDYKYFYIFPLIFMAVFLNYRNRDYDLNSFDGEIIGTVVSSKSDESIIKTKYINGKEFKTKILFFDKLNLGHVYKISGDFKKPLPSMNEGNFNSNLNFKSKGIYSIGKIKNCQDISSGNRIYKVPKFYIDNANKIFDKYLNSRNTRLLKSIVLGDRSELFDYQSERFKSLGISHILAVSGLHIGILSSFLNIILIKLTGRKRLTDLITLVLIGIYIFAIGAPVSVLRAFLFLILYKLSFYLKIDLNPKEIFFISLGIILFVNPMSIYSTSLILSYGAIFGMLFIYPRLKSYVADDNKITKSLLITASVLLILFPVLAYIFGSVSLLVFIANILIIPIYSLVIVLGFIMSFGIFPNIIGFSANFILNSLYGFESIILNLRFLSIDNLSINFTLMGLFYFAILVFFYKDKKESLISKNRVVIFLYIVTILIGTGFEIISNYNTYFERHIYVGQGDSSLISYKGSNYLIDTGGARYENKTFEKFLQPVLNHNGVHKLDAIFISHFDEDHAGNLEKILKNYKVDNIFFSYLPEDVEVLESASKHSNLKILNKGDEIILNRDIKLKVLSDNEKTNYSDPNDRSLVFVLDYKGLRTLFAGDISKEVEKNIDADIDILKVAHHGSKTSTSEEFLENTSPQIAIISSGVDNPYGHPHDEVIERLKSFGTKIYNTKDCGEIIISKDKRGNVNLNYFLEKTKINFLALSVIILKSVILYICAKEHYELQEDLLR
ncbi:MAG: DNA internalization-related competence protein ComEC/Rec2 [Peptoniphilus sp.]